MRAEQLLMIGVGALGLYAIYRLTKAPKEQRETPMFPIEPRPTPLQVPTGVLPDRPGVVPPAPANLDVPIRGNMLQLTPGAWYHGRLETDLAAREDVEQQLKALGLVDIRVFMTPQEASQDIFQAFALANPGKGTRWFRARLPAFLQTGLPPNRNVAKPVNLVTIWRAAAPPRVMVQTLSSGLLNEINSSGMQCVYVDHTQAILRGTAAPNAVMCSGPQADVIYHDSRGCRPVCRAHALWRSRLSQAGGHSWNCPQANQPNYAWTRWI